MQPLPLNLYRAEQVRELDRIAIEEYGTPGVTLMERAGAAAFAALTNNWPMLKSIAVLCGIGNNGGDGYVIARLAHTAGLSVVVLTVGDTGRLKGDARMVADRLLTSTVKVEKFQNQDLSQFDAVVDGLLGTGLKGAAEGQWADAIVEINRARSLQSKVLALDIPSGLNADTGSVTSVAVHADITMTFIGLKQGMFTASGPAHVGQLLFDDLAVTHMVYEKARPSAQRLSAQQCQALFPPRNKDTHKGQFGHVLAVGGNHGFIGAIRLTAEAAMRSGAGMVSVATRSSHAAMLTLQRAEIMSHGIETCEQLQKLISQVNVAVIGPGLGLDEWAQMLMSALLDSHLPLVVDADALTLLAFEPRHSDNWVLTPHPGEAARMLSCSTNDIQQDRFLAVTELQHKYGGTVILKGSGTLIYDGVSEIKLCVAGNPGMASAGMGDVLAGVAASFIAQGIAISEAAQAAVQLHAMAGDLAAQYGGQRGLIASDVMPYIRQLVNP